MHLYTKGVLGAIKEAKLRNYGAKTVQRSGKDVQGGGANIYLWGVNKNPRAQEKISAAVGFIVF